MIVVSDTSPLRYLAVIDAWPMLPVLFQKVVISPMVELELVNPSSPPVVQRLMQNRPDWLVQINPSTIHLQTEVVDAGEAEAISMALELGVPLLVDDAKAKRLAGQLGLECRGKLSVLVAAADLGLLSLENAFQRLTLETNFRAPKKVMKQLLESKGRSSS